MNTYAQLGHTVTISPRRRGGHRIKIIMTDGKGSIKADTDTTTFEQAQRVATRIIQTLTPLPAQSGEATR